MNHRAQGPMVPGWSSWQTWHDVWHHIAKQVVWKTWHPLVMTFTVSCLENGHLYVIYACFTWWFSIVNSEFTRVYSIWQSIAQAREIGCRHGDPRLMWQGHTLGTFCDDLQSLCGLMKNARLRESGNLPPLGIILCAILYFVHLQMIII